MNKGALIYNNNDRSIQVITEEDTFVLGYFLGNNEFSFSASAVALEQILPSYYINIKDKDLLRLVLGTKVYFQFTDDNKNHMEKILHRVWGGR